MREQNQSSKMQEVGEIIDRITQVDKLHSNGILPEETFTRVTFFLKSELEKALI